MAVTESLDYIATELEKAIKGGKTIEQAVGRAAAEGDQGEQADHLQRQQLLEGVGEGSRQARAAEPEEHGRRAAAAHREGGRRRSFEKYKVLNERELHARYEIMVETYNKTVNVEGQLMVLMANRYILPAALEYQKQVAQSVSAVKAAGGKSVEGKKTARQADEADRRVQAPAPTSWRRRSAHEGDGSAEKHAKHFRDSVIPAMDALRETGDALEAHRAARACGRSRPIGRCCSSSKYALPDSQ